MFTALVVALWAAFILYWAVSARRTRSAPERREALPSRLAYLALLGGGIALLVFDPPIYGPLLGRFIPDNTGTSLIGLALLLLGLGLAVGARRYLGQYWSARVSLGEGHMLVQTGPYSVVRHPIYLGGLVAVLGTAVVIGELRAVLSVACVLAVAVRKLRTEEAFLGERFGSAYRRYQEDVKALIPFIY
jgi:protein-S-isoprenylcysteine O-methyltransferase Ste14